MDTIELLSHQHRQALGRLAETEAGLVDGTTDLNAFVRFLEHDLALHFTLEEEALFPLLRRHPQLGHGPVAVMESEHVEFRAMVRRLADALEGGEPSAAEAAATALVEFLHAHIAKEDHVLFPLALRTLDSPERDEVDERARALLHGSEPRPDERAPVA